MLVEPLLRAYDASTGHIRTTTTWPLPRRAGSDHGGLAGGDVERLLLNACGITDIDELARRCMATRSALGQPTGRWTRQNALSLPIRMAVVNRGWSAEHVQTALLDVAADRTDPLPGPCRRGRSVVDTLAPANARDAPDNDLPALEARPAELDGHGPALQARTRAELADEGQPLTRGTVSRRAVQILDRAGEPA